MPTEEEHVKQVMAESKVDIVLLGNADGTIKVYEKGELVRSGGLEVGASYAGDEHVFCMVEEDDQWQCDKYENGIEGAVEEVDGA